MQICIGTFENDATRIVREQELRVSGLRETLAIVRTVDLFQFDDRLRQTKRAVCQFIRTTKRL